MACQAPPEFGDLRANATASADSDEVFRAALTNDSRSYCDQRVFAMAPACGPTFVPESLERIDISVAIVAGAADAIVRSAAAQEPTPRISRMPS
jgi:predicted dienelactone hydrolase